MNGWQTARARAEAAHAEGLGDPRAEAQGSHGLVPQDRQRRAEEEALDARPRRRVDQVAVHPVAVLAAVVAPRPLVQVALQPLVRDRVMRSAHARLEQAEEAFDG